MFRTPVSYTSGTELGSGNTEIKASVSEVHRLVERRLEEQLQGTVIVGGDVGGGSRLLWKRIGRAPPRSAAPAPLGSPLAPRARPRGLATCLFAPLRPPLLMYATKPFDIHLYF